MHIAIEGMDGVGKTSAAMLLAKRLNFHYYAKSFHAMRDTSGQYDNFITLDDYADHLINRYHFGLRGSFLYCKLKGIDVVSDRYFVSNFWAHTHGQHYDELKVIIDLLGEPDITFLLYGEQDIIHQRMVARNPHDKDLVKIAYVPRAYSVMKEFLARTGFNNVVIDTSHLSLEQVVDLMASIVLEGEHYDFPGHGQFCSIIELIHETSVLSQHGFQLVIRNQELKECTGQSNHLEIPWGIKRISHYAFAKCQQLKEVKIPGTVEYIAEQAFDGCGELTAIVVDPDNLLYQSIDQHLYTKDGKTLLQYAIGRKEETYALAPTTEKIGTTAFHGCPNLKKVELNPHLKTIGFASFLGCTSLTEMNIPASVEKIGKLAFLQCTSLERLAVDQSNPYYFTKGNMLLSDEGQVVKDVLQGLPRDELLVPPVKKVGVWAFAHAARIQRVILSEGLTKISAYCFFHSEVSFVRIPRSIEEVGDMAFYGCQKMQTIHLEGQHPPGLGKDTFANLPPQAIISIPPNSRHLFLAEKGWQELDYRLVERAANER